MIILTMRTDKPEAELGLYDDSTQLGYYVWTAHRQLVETIHKQIKDLLDRYEQDVGDIHGLIVFAGPGSFTGLRIGVSVANALAYSLSIPVVASLTDDWIALGRELLPLASQQSATYVLPVYGTPINITAPRK